ncbi:S9 family peptidase [Exilibacterium tricleocarpae]|uniref:S9 family peptidase n=1 Tax=Exilibacterium tricleocarpae TaxID=2591008 RepID=A0A545T1S8_9GAMM|nr:prolyl oligopeptidase family serine peptidase [Exilibacterium tricleocarpae]TQV71171.1 S9 family peptidase [Exilibacterium tricleocarpae]
MIRHCLLYLALAGAILSYPVRAGVEANTFFSAPEMTAAALSPGGKYIAAITNKPDGQRLELINPASGATSTLLNPAEFTERNASIRAITWVDDGHIAAHFSEVKKGVKDLLDTRHVQYLLVVRVPATASADVEVFRVRTKGWLVHSLPDQADTFLYAKSGPYSKVYRLKISKLGRHNQKLSKLTKKDGGQFTKANEVASVRGYATRWFIDRHGAPAAVLSYTANRDLVLNVFDGDGEPRVLQTWRYADLNQLAYDTSAPLRSRTFPIAMAENDDTFYCLDFAEEEERTVYKINYATDEETLVFETASFKIIDLILLPPDNTLIGVEVLRDGGIHSVYLDSQLSQPAAATTAASFQSFVSHDQSGKRSLVFKEGHSQPGRYVFKNNHTGEERVVGSHYPHLAETLGSRLVEQTVSVEGLEIPYLLTLPARKSDQPYPLIVQPHGGPIGIFDHRYFDLETQFLAANGYAVLRVNFRGSSGYTAELKEAGRKQWGKLMLTDIHRAALQVVSRADIDGSNVCAFGMSYGGYAATMLVLQQPDFYRCAITVAGVSDVNLYLNGPDINTRQDAWLKEYVGDTEAEYEDLKAVSPVYLAEQLQRPLLIMHGVKDEIVDIEHAFRLKLMLEKYQKPFTWHVFPEGEHGFSGVGEQAELFTKVMQFLAQNLGDR